MFARNAANMIVKKLLQAKKQNNSLLNL